MNTGMFGKEGFIPESAIKDIYEGGRPTMFTEANRVLFLKHLRSMGNITQACRLSRLTEGLVTKWLDTGKKVLDMVNTMDDDSIMNDYAWFHLDAYYQIAAREEELEGYILATAKTSKRWEAAAFLVERKSAENIYGMRQAMAVTGEVEHTFKVQIADGDNWRSGGRAIVESEMKMIESGVSDLSTEIVDTVMKENGVYETVGK